eukprot:UN04849
MMSTYIVIAYLQRYMMCEKKNKSRLHISSYGSISHGYKHKSTGIFNTCSHTSVGFVCEKTSTNISLTISPTRNLSTSPTYHLQNNQLQM